VQERLLERIFAMTSPAFIDSAIGAVAHSGRSPLARGLVALANSVATWEMRVATRRALRDLDPARLPDLGLTTAEVRRETAKPFWVA
jgi:uncharacterized protein YjiS (DUF1127 family)